MPRAVHIAVYVILMIVIVWAAPQEDPSLCQFIPIEQCTETYVKTQCPKKCNPSLCQFIPIEQCEDSYVRSQCPDKCSTPAEQCMTEDGFCVESDDLCTGTIKILHNSNSDHCSCCVPDVQDASDVVIKFVGNATHNDHFKLLLPDYDTKSILLGGRNVIYNLSLYDLTEQNRIEWYPDALKKQLCFVKGKSEDECQNYIRVLTKKKNGEFIICGTNAYKPMCRDYTLTNNVLEQQREFPGRGYCPFDHRHNSTSVYVDDDLYVGTTSDFSGLDPLIYREPLRTQQYDIATLQAPSFVSSLTLGDYVYFFFREIALEYMNCGKTTYSRVARVCRHDKGGPQMFRNNWTSFLKSRLNCSIPGEFPFYFDEIQATSGPVEGRYGRNAHTVVYGVFTTPENSVRGSAVCAFSFQHIMDTFEGSFKGQDSPNANWLPVPQAKVPEPRPGQCVRDSSILPNVTLNFIKSHTLMDEAVPALFGRPTLISTSYHSSYPRRFTSIEVDPQVRTPDRKAYDVLFVGTDDGKVLKAVDTHVTQSYEFPFPNPVTIEELQIFEPGTAIISLKIIRPANEAPRLLVTSSSQIHSIPLWRCNTEKITLCGECLALHDPHCAWDKRTRKCRATMNRNEFINGNEIIQSVETGSHAECNDHPIDTTDHHSANSESSSSDRGNTVFGIMHAKEAVFHILDVNKNGRDLPSKPSYVTTNIPHDSSEVFVFEGNITESDDFKLLLPNLTTMSVLVGGRNVIYNLSLHDLVELDRIEWQPHSLDMNSCLMKGGLEDECQNYVRILTETKPGEYLICGTNAYKPMCRDFKIINSKLELQREYAGRGLCPHDPSHDSTYVYDYIADELYVGTDTDFAGLDPIIYREPLRTEQYDLSVLNAPSFVSSFFWGDYVYFFFREMAVEHMNCGKTFYSRVARVCRSDKGGPHKFRNKWTSYLKSRLNCSIPGEFPFYFNEIQATSAPIMTRFGMHAHSLIYGVFTTPEKSIPGSAVCVFSIRDIKDAFQGPFKGQDSPNANWLPVNQSKEPDYDLTRPGECMEDSSMLPDETLNFVKSHPLMDEAVPAFYNQPILLSTSLQNSGRFTSIAVDSDIRTPGGKYYSVIFVGTDDGKVIKAVDTTSEDSYKARELFIIEEIQVFEPRTTIISLKIIRPWNKAPRILVTSRSQIKSILLWRCNTDKITLCRDCLSLRDPYCVWDKTTHECRARSDVRLEENEMLQSVTSGTHAECDTDILLDYHKNEIRKLKLSNSQIYLKWSPDSPYPVYFGSQAGESLNCDVCWKIHWYRHGHDSNDGSLVILETQQGGHFISVPGNTGSRPTIISDSTNSELSLSSPDARVFQLKQLSGTSQYSLRHLQTGKYISGGSNGEVVLIPWTESHDSLPHSARFLLFDAA